MILVVSPYHMTTREPAAMASLVLAEHAVAPLPTPAGAATRDEVTRAVVRITQYSELLQSWDWARPLFDAGICGTTLFGEDPLDDLPGVIRGIDVDERYASLRPFMGAMLEASGDEMLRAVCRDVIRAGPDPAVSVPVSACLDLFALRHDAVCVRSHERSQAQRYESGLSEVLLRCALPVILQGPADRLIEYRRRLAELLEALRLAIAALDERQARMIADAIGAGVERERAELVRVEDPDEPRVIIGLVSVTLCEQPADAVLVASSLAAAGILGRDRPEISRGPAHTVRVLQIAPIGGRSPRR